MSRNPAPIFRPEEIPALLERIGKRRGRTSDEEMRRAREIVERVRRGGDRALPALTRTLEGVPMSLRRLKVGPGRWERTAGKTGAGIVRELERTLFGIHACHAGSESGRARMAASTLLCGQRVLPLQNAGICVGGEDEASPLGGDSFQRRMTVVRCSEAHYFEASRPAETLSRAEGREACARALAARRKRGTEPSARN